MNEPQHETTTAYPASKWLHIGAALLSIILTLWLARYQLLNLIEFFRDREAVIAYLEPLGIWGPLLYVLLLGMQVISAIIPGHALMFTAGYLYGFDGGLALNLVGAIGASQCAFTMGRWAGRSFVHRLVPAKILNRWNKVTERQGFFFFLICFLFPLIPSNAANYMAGLSPISFWLFFLANLFGRLPGLIFITLIGSHGTEFSRPQWAMITLVGLLLVGGGRYLAAKVEHYFV